MKNINSENMVRIRDKELLDKLQSKFMMSRCQSVNEFIVSILRIYAFENTKQDLIIEKLENLEDTTNAIYKRLKPNE